MTLRTADGQEKFLSNLSHELRNPLAAILSSVELFEMQELHSPGGLLLLQSIQERVRSMTLLLDNLPQVARTARHTAQTPPVEVSPALPAADGSPTILVVDDNEMAALALGQMLKLRGHKVTIVHNGTDAVAKALELRPHIVILDIGLPDIDGYEVARTLRGQKDFSPILIALTGYGNEEDKIRATEAGFAAHLTKPVSLREVEAALQAIVPARL